MIDWHVWANIAALAIACLLCAVSSKSGRYITTSLVIYFASSFVLAATVGGLEWQGGAYYLIYSLFCMMFVLIFCYIAVLNNKFTQNRAAWVIAVMLYIASVLNVGVYYERTPSLWAAYDIAMAAIESVLLMIGFVSSGIYGRIRRIVNAWSWRGYNAGGRVDSSNGGAKSVRGYNADEAK